MAERIVLDAPLSWKEIAVVAKGAELALSEAAWTRIAKARAIVDALVEAAHQVFAIHPNAVKASVRSAAMASIPASAHSVT